MALAIGIVLGTTTLNDAVLDNLRGNIRDLTGDKRALEDNVRDLRAQVTADEQAARLYGPVVVDGRLAGQRVLLVSAPDAPAGPRDDLLPLIAAAGAAPAGQVRLTPALLESADPAELSALVAANPLPGVPLTGPPVQRAATLLATALTRPPTAPSITDEARTRVLTAFAEADLVDVDSDALAQPATSVVLLAGPAPVAVLDEAERVAATARTVAMLELARGLDGAAAGVVVAGVLPAGRDGDAVQALREDDALSERVSSVDDADTARGRIAVLLALQEQLRDEAGSYGSGPGAEAPLPDATASPGAESGTR